MDLVTWVLGEYPENPDQPLLVDALDPSRWLSFRLIRIRVRQLITGLQALNVGSGDCVCINSFNNLEYSILYLATVGAGAVFTAVNPASTSHELVHHFQLTKPKFIIAEPPMLERTIKAAHICGIPTSHIYALDNEVENSNEAICSWTSLLAHEASDWVKVNDPSTTTATLNSTSGTSGLPKIAKISHSYHIEQAAFQARDLKHPRSRLFALPPFHAFGSPILPSSIRQGITTYIMRRYSEVDFIASISRFGITETYLAPLIIVSLPKCPLATYENLASLRSIWFGGACVRYVQQKPLYNILHTDACIRSVWGMTETGWITCVQDSTSRQDDSVGQTLNGFEVRIIDVDGKLITNDKVPGEIVVRAPHPFLSYVSNDTATVEAFTPCSKFLRTGDVGYLLDETKSGNPYLFIVDRLKDLIKVRGWQVSPTEVESELLQYPGVEEAAVVGVKQESTADERVHAFVVRATQNSFKIERLQDGKSLQGWLRTRLASYKIPSQITFVDALPRNKIGKIIRHELVNGQ